MSKDEAALIVEQHQDNCLCPCDNCTRCPECQDSLDGIIFGEEAKQESL